MDGKIKNIFDETEYVQITNHTKISIALTILREVLPGEDFMIDEEKFREICSQLQTINKQLSDSYEVL